ncbi:Ubiquitin carboxyl-terminal hydrolase 8 [Holothuria leucospilota]|uniref:ubiquitinyl hydrolase 1 n=1 Tax=Holothuria leucospilota TaxID=206669 RepID=A0A9Q1C1S8_HOLLE|nr:Ubiquitin carboxyl-terminal hydrolase 8 [Holothuria leucospilota]
MMSGQTKKNIYIGKSLSDLNKIIDKSDNKAKPRVIANSATKIILEADKAYRAQDEERAYILYMRYALMWRLVKGSGEYKKDQEYYNYLLDGTSIKRALDHAEELSQSLKARYKYIEEEAEVKAKLSLQDDKAEEATNGEVVEEVKENGEVSQQPEEDQCGSSGWLTAAELYEVLKKKEFNILVMDVRSPEQYSSSHMKNIISINVPREIIKAGSTASSLQKSLPLESHEHWKKRGDFDYILLVDWDSSENDTKQGSTLASLKDALFKWDSTVSLKHEPLILQGGYSDWILRYPMYSTNSRVTKPPSYESLMKPKSTCVNREDVTTKPEDQAERLEREQQERETAKEKMELEKLRKKEEDVREQLERMRMEKTKLVNKELKKENEELEESIKSKMAEIKRLEIEMEAHKARLKKPQVGQDERVQGVTPGQEVDKSKEGTPQVKPPSSDKDEVKDTKANVPSPGVEKASNKSSASSLIKGDGGKQIPPSPNLPAGWEMKWDESKKRYYYINHNTKSSQWEFPTAVKEQQKASDGGKTSETVTGKEQAKPDSLRLVKPHPGSSPEKKPQGTTKVPLKTDATPSPGGSTLKRSFSSPNIAKMVADEEQFRKTPTVDRTKKPVNRPTPAQYYHQQQLVARKRHLDPVYGSQARGLTGLRNLGKTDFMNSVIQCLSNTTLLTRYFLSDSYLSDINDKNPMGHKGEMAIEFAVVVRALWAGQYKSIAPRDLFRMVTKQSVEFSMKKGHHHDSQECLIYLMDGLHEDLNQVKERTYKREEDYSKLPLAEGAAKSWSNHLLQNKSIIVSLFQGQFRSVVRCLVCNNKSVKYDSFMHLGLPIPSKTKCSLEDCLKEFSSEEKLVGDNAIHCSHCKRNRDSVKTIHICRLPRVLIIILKRLAWKFFQDGIWRQKLSTNVVYPLTALDMRKFSVGTSDGGGIYNLFGVSNHPWFQNGWKLQTDYRCHLHLMFQH